MSIKLLKFAAIWCAPCRLLDPIFKSIEGEGDYDDVEFEYIDIDNSPEIASKFKVMSIPTIVFIKDDAEIDRMVGLMSKKDLQDRIEKLR